MRILIISQYFWPENFIINDLAQGLTEKGHEITILTGLPNYPVGKLYPGYWKRVGKREHYEKATIIRAPLIPRGKAGPIRLAANYLSFAIGATLTGLLRCREDYDVVFVYAPSPITVCLPALVIKKLRKIPVVLNVQDLWPESLESAGGIHSPKILSGVRRMVRWIYHRCDKILVQSRSFIPKISAYGISKASIHYFPNWASDHYRPEPDRIRLVESTLESRGIRPFTIMYGGNLGEAQHLEMVIEAAEQLKHEQDILWVIVGGGRRKPWLEQQIKERELQKHMMLIGERPDEEMPEWFAGADALLVTLRPSPLFAWTVPSKLQAYMACGKPILAALDGEGAQIIHEAQAGLVAPSGNVQQLVVHARAMLLMSSHEREQMGRRARLYYEQHFQRDVLLEQLEHILHHATAGGGRKRK